jgi:hypothetical protein
VAIAGAIIATGIILALFLLVIVVQFELRHRHVWTIVSRREQPSPFEVMRPHLAGKFDWQGDPRQAAIRPVIVERRCETCGTEEIVRV